MDGCENFDVKKEEEKYLSFGNPFKLKEEE
jgi:hypothetical protein